MENNLYYNKNLLNNNNKDSHVNSKDMYTILNKEMSNSKEDNWIKLNNTEKIKKLYLFAETFKNILTEEKIDELKGFLLDCLNKKRFEKIKDINYDIDKKIITNIPGLKIKPKFILMRTDKRASTIRLPSNNKNKTKRRHKNK